MLEGKQYCVYYRGTCSRTGFKKDCETCVYAETEDEAVEKVKRWRAKDQLTLSFFWFKLSDFELVRVDQL